MNDSLEELELLPGSPGTPLFKTPEEERLFEEAFTKRVREAAEGMPRTVRFWSVGIVLA